MQIAGFMHVAAEGHFFEEKQMAEWAGNRVLVRQMEHKSGEHLVFLKRQACFTGTEDYEKDGIGNAAMTWIL